MRKVSQNLEENKKRVLEMIRDCDDVIYRPMKLGKQAELDCFLVYIETAAANLMLEDSVIGKMLSHFREMEEKDLAEALEKNSLGISDTKDFTDLDQAIAAMLAGNVLLFVEHFPKAFKIGSKGYPGMGVMKAESEKVLRGSREAFSESEKINTALIRKRIRDTRLKVKEKVLGDCSHTNTALVYMEGIASPLILQQIEKRLEDFEIDGVMDSGIVEHLTEKDLLPFPRYQTTERPDRAAMAALEGRIVFLSDNAPEALLLPATWNTLFQTSDDYYRHFAIVSFLRLIRYGAAFLAISLPGIYLAVLNFHPQMLPVNLLFSIAEARKGVPFPAVVEVLIMELSFELLREAGLRMPGPIGNTIGIVGGLIIGQAAVSANIVSPVAVVVVALTALGSFCIPNEELSEAFRLLKYGMILLCYELGILGLCFGWMWILSCLCGLTSFGIPYVMPFAAGEVNPGGETRDGIFRYPMRMMKKRPVFAQKTNRKK